jgi:radical SAM protein with 4Fe4S-binding SPASM domain
LKALKGRIKYLDLPRAVNRLRVEVDSRLRNPRVGSYPIFLIVEPCNICNLKCPLCPTGQRLEVPRGVMKVDTFKRIIDQTHRYVRHLNLFYLGEPMLCRDLNTMIAYAKEKRMRVSVSSNLNVFDEIRAEELVDSGLDHLIVSLDGTCQETYEKYRIGGNFDRVVENVKLLVQKKEEKNCSFPDIQIQFVIFRHNENEVEGIKELANSLGVGVYFRQGTLGGEGHSPPSRKDPELADKWLSRNSEYHLEYDHFGENSFLKDGACDYLWKVATINWDGSVFPCCWVFESGHSFGNILTDNFLEIWNNSLFQSSRSLFRNNGKPLARADKDIVCYKCRMFKHSLNS